jgi:hypothetical protein
LRPGRSWIDGDQVATHLLRDEGVRVLACQRCLPASKDELHVGVLRSTERFAIGLGDVVRVVVLAALRVVGDVRKCQAMGLAGKD